MNAAIEITAPSPQGFGGVAAAHDHVDRFTVCEAFQTEVEFAERSKYGYSDPLRGTAAAPDMQAGSANYDLARSSEKHEFRRTVAGPARRTTYSRWTGARSPIPAARRHRVRMRVKGLFDHLFGATVRRRDLDDAHGERLSDAAAPL